MKDNDTHICSICGDRYTGWGNNASPVNDGRCCDNCNTIVLVARINRIRYSRDIYKDKTTNHDRI